MRGTIPPLPQYVFVERYVKEASVSNAMLIQGRVAYNGGKGNGKDNVVPVLSYAPRRDVLGEWRYRSTHS
jgi:hypothetical protein